VGGAAAGTGSEATVGPAVVIVVGAPVVGAAGNSVVVVGAVVAVVGAGAGAVAGAGVVAGTDVVPGAGAVAGTDVVAVIVGAGLLAVVGVRPVAAVVAASATPTRMVAVSPGTGAASSPPGAYMAEPRTRPQQTTASTSPKRREFFMRHPPTGLQSLRGRCP